MVTYPSDWKISYIDKVADITTGRRDVKDSVVNGKYPFYVRSKDVERINFYDFDCEAVLTAGDGGAGKIFHYKNGKFAAHQRVYVISRFEEVDGKYFYYFFSKNFLKEVEKYTAKSTVDSVRRPMIANMEIPLPTLKEQQAIASTLSDFDEHIDNLTKLIEKKKAIRDGALEDLISGRTRIDGFNGEWIEKTLEDICVPNGLVRGPFGGSLKKEMFVSKGNKVYEQRNAIYKSVRIGDYYVTNEKYNELSRFAVKEDDFIVSCSGTIGKIYKIPKHYERGIINQALLKISIDKTKCDLDYFYKYFEWEKFQDNIIDNTQGGAMKNLVGMDIFRETLIRMPKDIDEQKAIAQIIIEMDDDIKAMQTEKLKMVQIKEGAMDDLLTGRVRLKV